MLRWSSKENSGLWLPLKTESCCGKGSVPWTKGLVENLVMRTLLKRLSTTFQGQMRGFHDLHRQKPSFFSMLDQISISVTFPDTVHVSGYGREDAVVLEQKMVLYCKLVVIGLSERVAQIQVITQCFNNILEEKVCNLKYEDELYVC